MEVRDGGRELKKMTASVWETDVLGWEPEDHSPQCTHNPGRCMMLSRKHRQEVTQTQPGLGGGRGRIGTQ